MKSLQPPSSKAGKAAWFSFAVAVLVAVVELLKALIGEPLIPRHIYDHAPLGAEKETQTHGH